MTQPVARRRSEPGALMTFLEIAFGCGEPLFDYFKVTEAPARVLYLCPEMGLRSFTDRLRKIGLMP